MFMHVRHRYATTTPSPSAESTRELTSRHGWRGLATVVAGALIATSVAIIVPTAAHADGGGFLTHLNDVRANHGLPPLSLNGELTAVAQAHTQDMAANGTISHNPSLGAQVTNWQSLGENVGMGSSVSAIDNAFDASPGHYANEVNTSYTQVGIGSVTAGGTIYVTLDFRRATHTTTAPPRPAQIPMATHAATQAEKQLVTQVAEQAVAQAAARKSADDQSAALTTQLRAGTDPLARAMVFSAGINLTGQSS